MRVGIAGAQPWRDTTSAPQALAYRQHASKSSPRTQPERNPDENASPAPSTLSTATLTPLPLNASSSDARNRAIDHRTTHRPALDDEHRLADRAHGDQRCHDVAAATGDVEFLDRADDEVDLGQNALEMRRDGFGADVTRLAVTAIGESPQHRPVVDVEHGAHVVLACAIEREIADPVDVFGGEMRAGDQQCPAAGDERLRRHRLR